MPLQDQILPLSFSQGIQTKNDDKQLAPGTPTELVNATFISPQDATKRDGHVALTRSRILGEASITVGNSVGTLNDTLCVLDGYNFNTYSENLSKWKDSGSLISASTTSTSIGNQANLLNAPQIAKSATTGLEMAVYVNATNNKVINFVYIDSETQQAIVSGSITTAAVISISRINIMVFNNQFVVLYSDPNNRQVVYYTFPTSVPTLTPSAPTTLLTDVADAIMLLEPLVVGNNFYLPVAIVTGSLYTIKKYDTSFSLVTSATVPAGYCRLVYDSYNTNIMALINTTSNDFNISTYNLSLTKLAGPTTITTNNALPQFTGVVVSSSLMYVYETYLLTSSRSIKTFAISLPSLSVTTLANDLYQATIIGAAFADSTGKPYLPIAYLDDNYSTGFIASSDNTTNYTIVAKFALNSAGISSNAVNTVSLYQIAQPIAIGGDEFEFPYLSAGLFDPSTSSLTPSYSLNKLTFSLGSKTQNLQLGGNLIMNGSLPKIFDGLGIAENGFNIIPSGILGIVQATSGGALGTGTYSYVVVYEWLDNQGNLHRSSPSNAVSTTFASGTTNKITFSVRGLGLSEPYKASKSSVVIYRTTANGSVYYKTLVIPNQSTLITGQVDLVSDGTIIGNQQLYTTGGEVENIGPPGFLSMTSFKNRIVGINSLNLLEWWYSKQVVQGFPIEFSDLFVQSIDQRGGPMTAISVLDDKLIFFKQSLMFYVVGDGPASSGLNNDFSYPQIISTDVGCENPSSIVLLPIGLMFQSSKGIYLLSRGLETAYIGSPVEAYNSLKVTSARMVPTTTQVRLTLEDSSVLVYDYFVNQWSIFSGLEFIDSAIYQNHYVGLKPNGVILVETPGATTDDGAVIPFKFKSGWLNLGGMQGYQRVKEMLLVGESNATTSLQVSFAYDFEDLDTQTTTIDITETDQPTQYRVFMARQKAESLRITIQDTPEYPSTGIISLSNMALEVALKKGPNKMSAAKSYG